MQIVERKIFEGELDSQNSELIYADLELRNCYFNKCSFGNACRTNDVKLRPILKNSKLIDCKQKECSVGAAIFEDVLIENLNLKTYSQPYGQFLQFFGAIFKHVTFKGKIDSLMLSPIVEVSELITSPMNRSFVEVNAGFYNSIDWALDISCADVQWIDIRGIPARLIKRDPETQVVVTAEKALKNNFRKLDYTKGHWGIFIQYMLDRGEKDVVLVAPKRNANFKVLLEGLQRLRREGIAEPD